jgi:hypothetical protein
MAAMESRAGRLWSGVAAAVLLLAVSVASDFASPGGGLGSWPRFTPSDRSPGNAARWWRFVDLARVHVPKGATYTVVAANSAAEMRLYMIAFGLLPDRDIFPTSYFGKELPEVGGRAEYVLAFGKVVPEGTIELVAHVEGGSVYRRQVISQ